jgi:hypothetical protein
MLFWATVSDASRWTLDTDRIKAEMGYLGIKPTRSSTLALPCACLRSLSLGVGIALTSFPLPRIRRDRHLLTIAWGLWSIKKR